IRPLGRSVTVHDPCHLAHGQGVRTAARTLLATVPGVRLVELEEADVCCGSAGTYNLTQPRMARRLLARKLDHITATGAEGVAPGSERVCSRAVSRPRSSPRSTSPPPHPASREVRNGYSSSPPFGDSTWPVKYVLPGPARKSAVAAISRGSPRRPTSVCVATSAL